MAKIQYRDGKRMQKDNAALLEKIVQIVSDYQRQGYRMTLRQLYYQLVARTVIPNKKNEYSKLSKILTEAQVSLQGTC